MPHIHGLNKTTLLDYPGRVAATIFLGRHAISAVLSAKTADLSCILLQEPVISTEEIFTFLQKRRGILEGVCISGGEPTLSADLEDFIRQIHALGYPVKLDTNGTHPEIIKKLFAKNLIQMTAVDIKACPDNYCSLTGLMHPDLAAVQETVDFLLNSNVDYEFRTTVVHELHSRQDFEAIGQWLKGAKAYYLQAYKDSEEVHAAWIQQLLSWKNWNNSAAFFSEPSP